MSDDPFGPGWWVGSDGNWHTPDEDFDADVPKTNHPVRRVAIVMLAVAVVGATTFGVWLGGSSQSSGPSLSGGPSPSELSAQVRDAVSGTNANGFGVAGVSAVICHPPAVWDPGNTFRCSVYDSSHAEIGVYTGIVQPTTAPGYWRWSGSWHPSRRESSVA